MSLRQNGRRCLTALLKTKRLPVVARQTGFRAATCGAWGLCAIISGMSTYRVHFDHKITKSRSPVSPVM